MGRSPRLKAVITHVLACILTCMLEMLVSAAMATPALAAGIDVTADHVSRNAEGVLVASGHVVIQRGTETLHADTVRYDVPKHLITAKGHVLITSPKARINAVSAILHTDSETGSMQQATLTLPNGEHLRARQISRLDATTFEAESIQFSACPGDKEAWRLAARNARLDQKQGVLVAHGTRFEIAGIPVMYSPYWQMPLRRHSGLLPPLVANGKRRGTEVALPFYFAPSPDWDATFTPHWMSARGFMPELELRHASGIGTELLSGEFIDDRLTKTKRGRYRADIDWQLPGQTFFTVRADHVSDRNYLPDYETSNQITTRYLQSEASLVEIGRYGDWMVMGRDQQDLTQANDAATPQIAPRLESHLTAPLARNLLLHFDQQTTNFERMVGVRGWRMDLHPYLEIPWQLPGGGLEITARAGSHLTRYWLQQQTASSANTLQRSTGEASLEIRSTFERISADRTWRHTIEPVLRYDYIRAPSDQTGLPNFDSSFGQLTMSNLLSGNRFSGFDRIERANRVTALLQSRLQHRDTANAPARNVLLIAIGASYDIQRSTVDPALKPIPANHWSNLLGRLMISPIAGLSLHGEGQYNSQAKVWAMANAGLDWTSKAGHELHLGYQFTDARFATPARLFSASLRLAVSSRWQMLGDIQYDSLLHLTQHASVGLRYQHPCWSLEIEGYRYNRPSGTMAGRNYGVRFLLGLRGVGSVGS